MSGSITHPAFPARRRHLSRALTALALAAATSTGLAACGGDDEPTAGSAGGGQSSPGTTIAKSDANAAKTVKLGSKNFTEQQVLGEVYAQALEAAGYTIDRDFSIGSEKIALKALEDEQIDAYPEYTGTALTNFFEVPSDEIPKDSTEAYNLLKADFEKESITALPPTPFTNSNAVGVTEELAKKDNLVNISDLSKVAGDLTLSGSPECRSRIDCLKGLEGTYGLKFKQYIPVDVALRHEVLTTGRADVSILFGTDPQITRNKFVVLKDDKQLFPPYNVSMLARNDVVEEAGPDFAKTIALVNTKLDAQVIQELNAKVDLDKETPAAAAKSYLTEFGFVS